MDEVATAFIIEAGYTNRLDDKKILEKTLMMHFGLVRCSWTNCRVVLGVAEAMRSNPDVMGGLFLLSNSEPLRAGTFIKVLNYITELMHCLLLHWIF